MSGWRGLDRWGGAQAPARFHDTRARMDAPRRPVGNDDAGRSDARSREIGFAILIVASIGLVAYAFAGDGGPVAGLIAAAVAAGAVLLLSRFWR